MRKSSDQDARLPAQEQLWRSMGLGRTKLRLVYATMAVLAIGIVAQGAERYLTVRELGTRVFVVVTDPSGTVSQVARAHADWQPDDGVWANQAQLWLRYVRGRTFDRGQWAWQTQQVRAMSDRDLYGPISRWMVESSSRYRDRAVDVDIEDVTLVGTPRPDGATVNLRWCERARRQNADPGQWVPYTGTISLAKHVPRDLTEKELAFNPMNVYVVDYSFQLRHGAVCRVGRDIAEHGQ